MGEERNRNEIKVIATNRKALHNYEILETLEAGIALTGTEIKSIRAGRVNIQDAYVWPEKGEMWLLNAHIAKFEGGGYANHDPTRPRKLLLHREEIDYLAGKARRKGLTIIPLKLYFSRNLVKVEIALARGLKKTDKRALIARRDAEREMRRALKAWGF